MLGVCRQMDSDRRSQKNSHICCAGWFAAVRQRNRVMSRLPQNMLFRGSCRKMRVHEETESTCSRHKGISRTENADSSLSSTRWQRVRGESLHMNIRWNMWKLKLCLFLHVFAAVCSWSSAVVEHWRHVFGIFPFYVCLANLVDFKCSHWSLTHFINCSLYFETHYIFYSLCLNLTFSLTKITNEYFIIYGISISPSVFYSQQCGDVGFWIQAALLLVCVFQTIRAAACSYTDI